jgi:hypothetical protein
MSLTTWCRTVAVSLFLVATIAASDVYAAPKRRVYVPVPPPAAIVEARVPPPGPGFVFVPGYYTWNGAAYLWVPGVWVRPVRAHARWVPGRWVHDPKLGWFFIKGHWR